MDSDIETIFTHTTDEGAEGILGIDQKGRLYWNGKVVVNCISQGLPGQSAPLRM